ncbi:uncharacterized protein LOC124144126 isoform X2 [Haliotis rufescens]|uniref:uncharacterized protein LOC124144126 isoform X2 n=1 Tax=Haliotis rufescens TaxID=6454 RepID=UPI00201F3791|nr:uncharacterized protein LOC124144126 isoform X2 [Haliotis rufescens]
MCIGFHRYVRYRVRSRVVDILVFHCIITPFCIYIYAHIYVLMFSSYFAVQMTCLQPLHCPLGMMNWNESQQVLSIILVRFQVRSQDLCQALCQAPCKIPPTVPFQVLSQGLESLDQKRMFRHTVRGQKRHKKRKAELNRAQSQAKKRCVPGHTCGWRCQRKKDGQSRLLQRC